MLDRRKLDLVVFTGGPQTWAEDDSVCFLEQAQEVFVQAVVILDKIGGQAGRVAGVLSTVAYEPGTRLTNMIYRGECVFGVQYYLVYRGTVG